MFPSAAPAPSPERQRDRRNGVPGAAGAPAERQVPSPPAESTWAELPWALWVSSAASRSSASRQSRDAPILLPHERHSGREPARSSREPARSLREPTRSSQKLVRDADLQHETSLAARLAPTPNPRQE